MRPGPDSVLRASVVLILCLGLASVTQAEERIRITAVGCDTIQVDAWCDHGQRSLQINRDGLFHPLPLRPDSLNHISLRLAQPGWGERLEFRLAGIANGLPEYSRDYSWHRAWPELQLSLSDSLLAWNIPACAPERLWLRVEVDGRLRDLRILPVSQARLTLDFDWTRLGCSWEECEDVQWFGSTPELESVKQIPTVLHERVVLPPPPELLSADQNGLHLRLAPGCRPLLLVGRADWSWQDQDEGECKLSFLSGGEILVAACNEEGLHGLPLVWQAPTQELRVEVEQLSPGRLILRSIGNLPEGSVLHWLSVDGRSGALALNETVQEVDGLPAMRLNLQLLDPGQDEAEALWSGIVETGWQPPATLITQSASDTSMSFSLPAQTPWADGIEVEAVYNRKRRLYGPAPNVVIQPTAEMAYLDLRWRTSYGSERSDWSPWSSLGLVAHAVQEPTASDAARGAVVRWSTENPWLMDQVDLLRIVNEDSLLFSTDWKNGEYHDLLAPAQQEVSYLVRNRCTHSTGEWQGGLVVKTSADGIGWPVMNGVAVSPVELSVAEYLSYCKSTARSLPPNPPLEGYKDWFSWPARPLVHVSPAEATAYCNWLSERAGLPKMYHEDATPGRERGGFRLPTIEEMQRWSSGAAVTQELHDVFPVRLPADSLQYCADNVRELCWSSEGWLAPGASWIRHQHGNRPLHIDQRLPDTGFRLVLDLPRD